MAIALGVACTGLGPTAGPGSDERAATFSKLGLGGGLGNVGEPGGDMFGST